MSRMKEGGFPGLNGLYKIAALAALGLAAPAFGATRTVSERNVVADWISSLSRCLYKSAAGQMNLQSRLYAVMHLAMHDAAAEVGRDRRLGANAVALDVAAAAAAYATVVGVLPSQRDGLSNVREAHRAALDGERSRQAQDIGDRVAGGLLARRHNDGWLSIMGEIDGVGGRFAGAPAGGRNSKLERIKPFVLRKPGQFMAEPPWWVTMDGDVLPVLRLRDSTVLDLPRDLSPGMLELWSDELIPTWNRIARAIAAPFPEDARWNARMFAALNCAMADALLAATFWRREFEVGNVLSVSGELRESDSQDVPGSPGSYYNRSPGVSVRIPLRTPDYPVAEAAIAGAAQAVLGYYLAGDNIHLSLEYALRGNSAGVRQFTSVAAMSRECAGSAVMRRRASREAGVSGYELGVKIGHFVASPIPRTKD